MKKEIYIYHNLGLGDHIICNGLVRSYALLYDMVYVFCKPHNVRNVVFMYKDNDKIKVLPIEQKEIVAFIRKNNKECLVARSVSEFNDVFDVHIYKTAKLSFLYKWSMFGLVRDLEREKKLFKKLGLSEGEEFIFVHDQQERLIDESKLPKGIKVIKPIYLDGFIFDYLYTIEKAKEVHCIDSSFVNLIDCMQLRDIGLFFHKYVRIESSGEKRTPTLVSEWKVLN